MTDEDTWPELGSPARGLDRTLGECFDTVLPSDLVVTGALTGVAFGALPPGGAWLLVGFGLVLPFALVRVARFLTRGHTHRGELFEFSGRSWPFFLAGGAALVAIGLGADLLLAELHHLLRPFSDAHPRWVSAGYWAVNFAWLVSVEAGVRNALVKHTRCGTVRFESRLEVGPLLWLYVTNVAAVAVSLGLLVPWAELRLRTYRRSRVTVVEPGQQRLVRSSERELGGEAEEHADAIPSRQKSVKPHEREIEPVGGREVEP
jgi:uncharacterized membrane protein YjgN (DUF898 family)